MESQFTISEETTTFVHRESSPDKPVLASGAVVAHTAKKKASGVEETPEDLFSTEYIANECELEEISGIIARHKCVLSATRPGTKTMERAAVCVRQLEGGDFVYSYQWDRSWLGRVSGNYPVLSLKFGSRDEVLRRIDDALSYVEERQSSGYWYPPKRRGKAEKVSLANFMASPMKNGNWWSPFLEVACCDAVTPRMYRAALGSSVCEVLDEILNTAWFGKDFMTMCKFYKGVADLRRWHADKARNATGTANYYLASFAGFLALVKQCNAETGCVGPSFIGPWANKWGVLKDWMKNIHGVDL